MAIIEAMSKRWLHPTLLWTGIAVVAIAVGLYATPPQFPRPSGAAMQRALPRLPGPAPDFRTRLYLLGVGSIVWYAAAVSLPSFLLAVLLILLSATMVSKYGIRLWPSFGFGWDDPFFFDGMGFRTVYTSFLDLDIKRAADGQSVFEGALPSLAFGV